MQNDRKNEKIYKHANRDCYMRYIPILRFRTTEHGILTSDLSRGLNMLPHLEVVDLSFFQGNIQTINRRFGDVLMELPEYLTERANKYRDDVADILNQYGQVGFYTSFQDQVGIPVISCRKSQRNYSVLLDRFERIRDQFDEVAIRFFIHRPLLTRVQEQNLASLFEDLRNKDIVLFDILRFSGIEQRQVRKLRQMLETISNLAPECEVYILNAFGSDHHNYSPLITNILDLDGFGDYSTIPRTEPKSGGGVPTKIIRYYHSSDHELVHFTHDTSFLVAAQELTNSSYWDDNVSRGHLDYCNVCDEIRNNRHNNTYKYWKRFRIVHYIKSIVNDTLPSIPGSNPRDLDVNGYDRISRRRGI